MAATPDSQAKFEAVLALLVQLRPGLTRTQLLKLAYFVDFDSYQSEGHSVTGLSWLALPFGPVPHDFQRRLSAIVLTGLLTASPSNVGDHDATRYSLAPGAQIPAVLDLNQQAYVENVVADRGGASAARLVSDTHLDVPWRAVWKGLSGEPIPYDLASQRPDMDPWERAPSNIRKHLEQAAHHRLITTEMATAGINTARCLTRWTGLPVEAVVSDDGGVSIETECDDRELSVVIAQAGRAEWAVYFSTRRSGSLEMAGKIKNLRGLEDLAQWLSGDPLETTNLLIGRPPQVA